MSYRTFKHLLGETSLERKCRFIFGAGILCLVTVSFYWYGQKTERLVIDQNREAGRALIPPILQSRHMELLSPNSDTSVFTPDTFDRAPVYKFRLIKPATNSGDRSGSNDASTDDGVSQWEREWLSRFVEAAEADKQLETEGIEAKPLAFRDGTSMEAWRISPDRQLYQYLQAIRIEPQCMMSCHEIGGMAGYHYYEEDDSGTLLEIEPGDLAGMVVVNLPMERTTKAIHQNRAILISAALVTAILAMVASYVIVRYVIVKPVKHLRDVSDAISSGKLNIRSQIQTGDEFEELSHAFNRMLHNLVAMQQELRSVNDDLDRKVDELAQANLALFEMNRLKSDFLATMSHELRTPLNSIIGFSEVLSGSDRLTEKQRRYAANIQKSGKILLGMINDILDLAKIESGKMEVKADDFSIRDVCEGLVNLMRPQAEKKDLILECQIDESVPLLRQDPGKLKQIIYNLLSNAVKFTPEGGRVTLRARAMGHHLVIEVIDTGIGIAEEDREAIFEKFRQVQPPGTPGSVLTRQHEGTGLGLSIVRELTQLLGGKIELESQPGMGSTFTVRVPLQLEGSRSVPMLSDSTIDLSRARLVSPHDGQSAATRPMHRQYNERESRLRSSWS